MGPTRRAEPLAVAAAVVLAAVAGFVDAIAFLRLFEVFPANQSGNAILLGISMGDPAQSLGWRPLVAMVGFAVGVAVAVAVRRAPRVGRPGPLLLAIEVVLLAGVTLAVGDVTATSSVPGARGLLLLAVAAVAMGVQTEVTRAQAGVALATTYQTGALVQIAEGSADRHRGSTRWPVVVPLAAVLAGYVGGATGGAALAADRPWVLAVPVAALVVLLVTEPWWARPAPPPAP